MDQFFAKDYAGAPFQIFSLPHLIVLGVLLLLNVLLTYFGRRASEGTRKTIRSTMAVTLVLNEASWHLWHIFTGQWTIQTMLPLHLCAVMVWASAYMLVTRKYAAYEYLYFLGIGGAIQAILTPDLGQYGFPHFRFFQTFISHGLILTAAIYMTTAEGYRPFWKSIGRVIVGANVYMAFVGVVNALIGSNYLFIAHKPETPCLIDLMGPWPWYILGLEAVGLITCLILYLPFAARDRIARPAVATPQ